jgi:hypothetical protein
MHIERRQKPVRRLETPAWALSDEKLREVVVRYLENRFHINDTKGTWQERLVRCQAAAMEFIGPRKRNLERLMTDLRALAEERFTELSNYERVFLDSLRGQSQRERLRIWKQSVQAWDSEVYACERIGELILAVAHNYYRLNWPSPSVGESLGISAPAVRQILFRMNKIANALSVPKERKPRFGQ